MVLLRTVPISGIQPVDRVKQQVRPDGLATWAFIPADSAACASPAKVSAVMAMMEIALVSVLEEVRSHAKKPSDFFTEADPGAASSMICMVNAASMPRIPRHWMRRPSAPQGFGRFPAKTGSTVFADG
ncbi:MAG: hypothetical protein HPZ89_07600 [Oscillospiraceae bacterium]|nr:hypothetical protein [Oscillospiraceae bacterium]